MGWLSGWNKRKQITISATNVDDDLTDFPLCVPVTRSNVDNNYGLSNGDDIRFTTSDGTTLLYQEWTGWNDDDYSGAFVKVPSIDSTNGATIYMYYDNASTSGATNNTQVWSDYVMSAHLDDWTNGQYESASDYSLAGTPSAPSGTTGVVGGGVIMDGTKGIEIGNIGDVWSKLVGENGFTLSLCILDVDYSTTNHTRFFYQDEYGQPIFCNFTFTSAGALDFHWYPNTSDFANIRSTVAAGVTTGDDIHVVATFQYSGGNAVIRTYKNGTQIGTTSKSSSQTVFPTFNTPGRRFRICYPGYGCHGIYDEVRIKIGAASAAWTKFEYANLMLSGNQLTFGEEESSFNPSIIYYYQRMTL